MKEVKKDVNIRSTRRICKGKANEVVDVHVTIDKVQHIKEAKKQVGQQWLQLHMKGHQEK